MEAAVSGQLRVERGREQRALADDDDLITEGRGDGREDLEANVARLRDEYQRLYTEGMVENIARLHEADARRSSSTPSTPGFHEATRDTEDIAADIWEQARRGDRPR